MHFLFIGWFSAWKNICLIVVGVFNKLMCLLLVNALDKTAVVEIGEAKKWVVLPNISCVRENLHIKLNILWKIIYPRNKWNEYYMEYVYNGRKPVTSCITAVSKWTSLVLKSEIRVLFFRKVPLQKLVFSQVLLTQWRSGKKQNMKVRLLYFIHFYLFQYH